MSFDRYPHPNMLPPRYPEGLEAVPLPGRGPGIGIGGRTAVPLPNPGWGKTPPWIQELQNRMSDPMAIRQGTGMYGPLSRHTQNFEQTPVAVAPTGPRRPPTFGREPLPGYWTGPAQNPMPWDVSPMRPLPDIGRNPWEPDNHYREY